ncbi:CAP domain-containing protein [Roseovarius aquimarinus]|uniref:CAP domain-containing protein n=1 Tax=Roseovarius aquimarinus TaxID=1229156 RepID=A0ABW7I582_9RHOB
MRCFPFTIPAIVIGLTLGFPSSAAAAEDRSAAARAAVADIRSRHGLAPLDVSPRLVQAAAAHARDMQANGFFSHTGSNGSGIGDRARAAGYGFCFIAENIAKGQGSLAQVMEGWMGSTGHRRNILSEGAREFALVEEAGNIWVMVLGRPGC